VATPRRQRGANITRGTPRESDENEANAGRHLVGFYCARDADERDAGWDAVRDAALFCGVSIGGIDRGQRIKKKAPAIDQSVKWPTSTREGKFA
jgi:hypothetical protein